MFNVLIGLLILSLGLFVLKEERINCSDKVRKTKKGKLNTTTTLFVESRKDRQRRINRKQRDEWHKSYDAMGIGYSYNFNNPHKNRYRRTFFG
jgi:hypothetical protein